MSKEPAPLPEAVVLRTEGFSVRPRCVVTLTQTGMGWQLEGRGGAHWVEWPLIGRLSDRVEGRTVAADVLAIDGSLLGTVVGLIAVDGVATTLAHVVALFRPEMFVEIEGDPWSRTGGCIRREVAEAEDGWDEQRGT